IIVSLTLTVLIAASAATARASAAAGSSSRAADEAEIRSLVTQLQEAWNKGDGKAFAEPFAEDADYVVVNGMYVKGRTVIGQGHQRIFDTIYKNSHNTGTVERIRFLRDDVAVVHVEWLLKRTENGAAREARARATLVVTKDKGRWSIAAFHNTPIEGTQK
ncbi:MAG TPA: SgcJ/EcaC family oxidoreductase, partial [Blastocatellia bacterium]|nr:SgcJ/EcaC family oxidoreductase [Blastocatellia bacterium]